MSRWSYGPEDAVGGRQERRPTQTRETPKKPPENEQGTGSDGRDRGDAASLRHRGRRQDDRGRPRRTRGQREQQVLELLGTFRVVSRRRLVEHCFHAHPFAASRVLPALEAEGLIAVRTVPVGATGYQVMSLTGTGQDRATIGARKRRRELGEDDEDDPQRYWRGLSDVRQLAHDARVFEAVMQDTEPIRREGGRVRRVRLESELRGLLAVAGETVRRSEGARGAERARRRAAERIGLRMVAECVPLPDALVEVEDVHGRRSVRAIEVVTGSYTSAQVRQKRLAGFRLYAMQGYRTRRGRRPHRTRAEEDLFPLCWESGR